MEYKLLKNQGALQEGRGQRHGDEELATVLLTSCEDDSEGIPPPEGFHRSVRALPDTPQWIVGLITESMARENMVFPLHYDGERLTLASANPDDIAVTDKLRFVLAKDVRLIPAPVDAIANAIDKHYGETEAESVDSMLCEFTETEIDFAELADADCLSDPSPGSFGTRSRFARTAQKSRKGKRRSTPSRRPAIAGYDGRDHTASSNEGRGMFFYTVDESKRVLMTNADGRSEVLVGPRRVWRWRNRFEQLRSHVAHPGEFLITRFRDGRQEHTAGPTEQWFDPRIHESIQCEDALQIAANEAVVVYTEDKTGKATRRVEHGPQLFMPKPGEWLHTFTWHASHGGSKGAQKVPKGLVFQKLWLMPDQMYHDVRDVRTADDALLTVRLMIFFELKDIDRMLDSTHDPIGDFVNAATADVVGFTAHHEFEEFKQHTDKLNDLSTYQHLVDRAEQCGYKINNVVFRGYGAPDSLQRMQDQAIEARTKLQLERDTEEQAQQLEDYRLESQLSRGSRRRSEQADEIRHELELDKHKQTATLENRRQMLEFETERKQQTAAMQNAIQLETNLTSQAHYRTLSEMGVDLTAYLTQARADEVIEVRGGKGTPHLHIAQERNQSKPR